MRQLNLISGHSIRTHKRINSYWLSQKPPESKLEYDAYKYLVSDGTYLHHENCVYTVMDYPSGLILSYGFGVCENYSMALSVFGELKDRGCIPKAITIDGNKPVLRALKDVWPGIDIQRCLYHILRQGTSWLRRFPKDLAAKTLRQIILKVTSISNHEEKDELIKTFKEWESQYGEYVLSQDSHNKVWSDIQRARSLLINALPDMFYYLDDPNIASTSNKQEGLFSCAKIVFRNHRGVKKTNRENYFKWYFYLKNNKITNYFGY